MIVYIDVLTFEIAISLILAAYLSVLVLTKKDAILSNKGKDIVRHNMGRVKSGALFLFIAMLLYLEGETAEIISELFPSAFDVDLRLIYEYSIVLDLFLLAFALMFFLSVLIKVGEKSG